MIRSLGSLDTVKIFGLAISNALVALAGQNHELNNFADVNMGLGMLVSGLASVIIEVLFRLRFSQGLILEYWGPSLIA